MNKRDSQDFCVSIVHFWQYAQKGGYVFVFYNNFLRLCNSINKSPSRVAVEIGTTRSSVNRWKSGSIPSDATLTLLADYFGVTVEELLKDNEKPAPTNEGGTEEKLSRLSPKFQKDLALFLELAKDNPDTAERFLSFAVQELQSARQDS